MTTLPESGANMMSEPSSILVVGNLDGRFIEAFEKISVIHGRKNFTFAIIVGNLFADYSKYSPENDANVDALLAGKIHVPLPTYFAQGSNTLPTPVVAQLMASGDVLCKNLSFLGKHNITTTMEGIRIVALGGQKLSVATASDKYSPFYMEKDVKALQGANRADILVTSEWPASVRVGSLNETEPVAPDPQSYDDIADLSITLKPRYHISVSPAFYEREPFFHPPKQDTAADGFNMTRFLSLATFDPPTKTRWMFAFYFDPSAPKPQTIPEGTTTSPFTLVERKKRGPPPRTDEYSRFGNNNDRHNHNNRPHKRARAERPGTDQCFFCLSSKTRSDHLVTTIGEKSYMTTAKGPITLRDTYPSLGFPAHMLIVPLDHAPTQRSADKTQQLATVNEMCRLREALNSMVAAKSAGTLGSVSWELSRTTGIHIHWQYLPLTMDLIRLVEIAFKAEGIAQGYPLFHTSAMQEPYESEEEANREGDSFKVWIWTSDQDYKTLNMPLPADLRFDAQFGRRVIAKLLNLAGRDDWKKCAQSMEEETVDVEAFRKAFETWDFT